MENDVVYTVQDNFGKEGTVTIPFVLGTNIDFVEKYEMYILTILYSGNKQKFRFKEREDSELIINDINSLISAFHKK